MPQADSNRLLPPQNAVAPWSAVQVPGSAWTGAVPFPDWEPETSSVPLSHYLWILRRQRWRILAFMATCLLATFVVSSRLTPIYESTATVDVDRRMPTGVVGQEASNQAMLNDSEQFLATQIKLIQSDSVLRPVVQQFHLPVAEPDQVVAKGLKSSRAQDAPITLKNLKVTRPPNTYLLLISYRSPDTDLAAAVANAIAQSYIEHTFNIRIRSNLALSSFMERQTEELKATMERSSAALAAFEKELNVINPEDKTSILSARLLQLNTEFTNAQTDRLRKEAALSSVRTGSLEAAQVSSQGDTLRTVQDHLIDAQEKFTEASQHFGPNHPEYRKASSHLAQAQQQVEDIRKQIIRRLEIDLQQAQQRENMLAAAVTEAKAEADGLNARSFQYRSLKQDAEADKQLYQELVRKIREAGLNAGFQGNAIRLADPARPALFPVFPNMKLNLALALLLSGLLAVGVAIVADTLDKSIRDPEQVKRLLNTDVVGSLPLVRPWRKQPARIVAGPSSDEDKALVHGHYGYGHGYGNSASSFEEAIATLRNSILLQHMDAPLRSVMITSANPSEGKTTTAVYLALAHARQNHRTLLIDCDLRRPGAHRTLGIDPPTGFSTALLNGMKWKDQVIRMEGLPKLEVLVAGPPSRRAADMVGKGLEEILQEAEREYDLIVVDSPPLLGFPEPLQMATSVDGVVIVARAGETNRKAVGGAIETLHRLKANLIGLVLNEISRDLGDNYYYSGYYGKHDKYYRTSETPNT